MNQTINFIIVGSGNIAKTYLKAIENIPEAEVVGIVSRQLTISKSPRNQKLYTSLSEIEEPYDAVIICTPNGLHHLGAVQAARLGKHVLCEKPIDIKLESIDQMIKACHHHQVKLGVVYQRRYSSDNPIIKELIEGGKLGRIFSVNLSIKNYRDDAYYNSAAYRGTYAIDGGGPFMQQASHYIDLYCWYFGKPEKIVSKMSTFVHDIEVEDHGVVICMHDDGILSTLTASTATKPGFPAKMEIYSEKGYCILENDVITAWNMDEIENPSHVTTNANTHTGAATALVEDTSNHEVIIKDFMDAINHDRDPLITGESARVATEVILEIYQNQF